MIIRLSGLTGCPSLASGRADLVPAVFITPWKTCCRTKRSFCGTLDRPELNATDHLEPASTNNVITIKATDATQTIPYHEASELRRYHKRIYDAPKKQVTTRDDQKIDRVFALVNFTTDKRVTPARDQAPKFLDR
jgi:hypothetical protein